jgi:hypothetical protein
LFEEARELTNPSNAQASLYASRPNQLGEFDKRSLKLNKPRLFEVLKLIKLEGVKKKRFINFGVCTREQFTLTLEFNGVSTRNNRSPILAVLSAEFRIEAEDKNSS